MISLLVLVREHDRGPERLEPLAEALRPEVPDRAPGGEVDAHARRRARPPGATLRRSARGGASNRAGAGACSRRARPGRARRRQVGRDAAVGGHGPAAVRRDERDDGPGAARDRRPDDLDAVALERPRGDPARLVVRALADEARLTAELRHPGGDVRGLAAGTELRDRVRVGPFRERLAEPDDHVQQQVPEGRRSRLRSFHGRRARRSRTRSFLVGAAVGASAAIAAARRLRPKERRRETPAGLAAFEEAPCYRELVEREREAP